MNYAFATGAIRRIAMLGNHLPRQCGIATFTTDLSDAIAAKFSELDCFVVAMNDAGRRHAYPPRLRFEVVEGDISSYRHAAEFLNAKQVDVVCAQHGYGIFGGEGYRESLERRAQGLGVESSMIFHNRFVSRGELVKFLSAADIYVTPYLNPERSTSGTLAYAIGSSKAVISTPYHYARKLLADGRGVLWPTVARGYLQSFDRACTRQQSVPRVSRGLGVRVRRVSA